MALDPITQLAVDYAGAYGTLMSRMKMLQVDMSHYRMADTDAEREYYIASMTELINKPIPEVEQ
jgi:hypothetical protein